MINRVNEDYFHYLMCVVYAFDKLDKIILNHHYRRYFHLRKNNEKYNEENRKKKKNPNNTKQLISISIFLTIIV